MLYGYNLSKHCLAIAPGDCTCISPTVETHACEKRAITVAISSCNYTVSLD